MKLLKNFSIYTISSIINNGISFLLIPVFTTHLTTADYGTLGMFTILITLTNSLIGISSYGAIQSEYYHLEKDKLSKYISSALVLNFVLFILFYIVIYSIKSNLTSLTAVNSFGLTILPVIAFLNIPPQVLLIIFQSENKPIHFGVLNVSQAGLNLLLSVVFVVFFHYNWEGRAISLLISTIFFSTISVYILYKKGYFGFSFRMKYVKSVVLFGLPLIPHAIGGIVIESSDRLFIKNMINLGEVGIYNAGYQIALIITVIDGAFSQAFVPYLFTNLKIDTPECRANIVKVSYYYLMVLLFAVISLTLLSPIIFKYFIGKDFQEGAKYVFWISLGCFALGTYKVFAGYMFYYKKTVYLAYLSVVNIACNLILNYILIKFYGAIGAAYATLISYIVLATLTGIIAYKIKPMPWLKFGKHEKIDL